MRVRRQFVRNMNAAATRRFLRFTTHMTYGTTVTQLKRKNGIRNQPQMPVEPDRTPDRQLLSASVQAKIQHRHDVGARLPQRGWLSLLIRTRHEGDHVECHGQPLQYRAEPHGLDEREM